MSNKKITDLTELTTPTTDDVFPVVDIATNTTQKVQLGNLPTTPAVTSALASKQATLVSGTNIKTVNGNSVLGSGDINIPLTPPSGVSGAIQFSTGSAFASDASNLFWDDTNNRLGIGTNAPTTSLQINYASSSLNGILINQTGGTSNFSSIGFANNGTIRSTLGMNLNSGEVRWFNSSNGYFATIYSNGVEAMRIDTSQNVNIGATALGARVGIKGSGSTSATTSLFVQNSAGTHSMSVRDNGSSLFGPQSAVEISNTISVNAQSGNQNLIQSFGGVTNGTTFRGGLDTSNVNFEANTNGGVFRSTGTTAQNASSVLDLQSTTRGFLPPRMTTTQKNAIASPAAGLVVYDSTTNKLCCYNGSTWNDLF